MRATCIFPELVQRVLHAEPVSDLTGVYTRRNIDAMALNGAYGNAPPVKDLDALPIPDYDDFFDQLRASRLDRRYPASIMFETSRGCWWGERSHCTFCGLSDATMPFRGKSARRAVDELVHLTSRYPGCAVVGVDWILNVRAFDDFLPELAARRLDVELFYEVKANLKKAQVRLLRDAGVRVIQPGIESFSSNVLARMRKGVKGLQNIQLLKWCKEFGITPHWNLLWGFPHEPPEEYARMAALLPLLTHLTPPQTASAIRIDRFSPNFDRAGALGFADVQPFAGLSAYLSLRTRGRREPGLLLHVWISRAPGRRALHGGRRARSAAVATSSTRRAISSRSTSGVCCWCAIFAPAARRSSR